MNDLAMQNDRLSCRTNVRELPVIWLGRRRRANRRPVSGVFLHPVKMDVRLVSFPLSGVRNDLAKTKICHMTPPSPQPLLPGVHRNCGQIFPTSLRQLPQCLLQFRRAIDFRHNTLQRLHRGSDVL